MGSNQQIEKDKEDLDPTAKYQKVEEDADTTVDSTSETPPDSPDEDWTASFHIEPDEKGAG